MILNLKMSGEALFTRKMMLQSEELSEQEVEIEEVRPMYWVVPERPEALAREKSTIWFV